MSLNNRLPSLLTAASAGLIMLALSACFSDGHNRSLPYQAAAQAPLKKDIATTANDDQKVGPIQNGIRLVYPHDGSAIDAPSTFLVGAVSPGSTLTQNGQAIKINKEGFFAEVVPLNIGSNSIELIRNGDPQKNFNLTVLRPAPPQPVPAQPLQILTKSLQPAQDIGVEPGDLITFAMRGSPGARASVRLGNRSIPLHAADKSKAINQGLATDFGVTYQRSNAQASDLYTGFYRVSAQDGWQSEHAQFVLNNGADTVNEQSPSTITVISQPFIATTLHDDTIVRVGPGAGRTTPLVAGVRLFVDGFVGDSYRLEMCNGKHLWIEKKDLNQTETAGEPPRALVHTINIENEGANGARLVIPLNQRLPYEIKQETVPTNRLQLKIYGATANTDWITEPSTRSDAVSESIRKTGQAIAPSQQNNPLASVTWQQLNDSVYQVTANIKGHQQWGFYADYEDSRLILHIKGTPAVAANNPLKGLRICLDPGHGGKETGAIGCSGVKEATINLAIAKRAQALLNRQGATVIMTRTNDVDVSLADRVALAIQQKADLLISIHNNSLPDGRNPWAEHGTSSYYYQPQSLALAKTIRQGVVRHLGFKDFHTRWQNLALCRPSQMPAQLLEVGFLVNPDEYAGLLTASGQERAAVGILEGIENFMLQALNEPAAPCALPPVRQPAIKHRR